MHLLSLGEPPGLSVAYLTIELFYYLVTFFDLALYNARVFPLNSTPLRRIALPSEMEEYSGLSKWNIFYSALRIGGRRTSLPDGHQHRLGYAFPERNPPYSKRSEFYLEEPRLCVSLKSQLEYWEGGDMISLTRPLLLLLAFWGHRFQIPRDYASSRGMGRTLNPVIIPPSI